MPSYYDSTKKKPGKAKLKYQKGGEVKKGDRTVTKEDRRRDAQIKKELQESYTTVNGILMYKGKPVKRMSAADRAAREKKEEAAWDAEYEQRKKDKQSRQEQRRHEELQQHRDEIAREEKQRGKQGKTAPKSSGSYTDRWLDKVLNKKKQKLIKTKQGGRVKQMAEGGTVARGSGAARPQRFGRNG